MEGRYVLLSMKINGLKSIDKPIEIRFSNKRVDADHSLPYVKAIYGSNGEGKTAIAQAFLLYRNSILDRSYLIGRSYSVGFNDIINQRLKCAEIQTLFAWLGTQGERRLYRHRLQYILSGSALQISKEEFAFIKGDSFGGVSKEDFIYSTENGAFVSMHSGFSDLKDKIVSATNNLLNGVAAALPIFPLADGNGKCGIAIKDLLRFASSIRVYLEQGDQPKPSKPYAEERLAQLDTKEKKSIGIWDDFVSGGELDGYLSDIKRVEGFLKVFKPELDRIEIEQSFQSGVIVCKKVLVYETGDRVSLEYESSGIKKLFRLYGYLDNVEEGGISFIDEFDSNIHDVYLCKLIEYFSTMASGQLIFTTHNLGPMETLSATGLKHAIDFLSGSTITSWKRNGNYSVVKLYRNGAIPNSPFNIDSSSFVRTFGGQSK